MNNIVRQKLREIIVKFGQSLVEDSPRCEGLLRDLIGIYKIEINVLILSLKEGVVSALLNSS
jgi:hypothetical protein